MKFFQLEDLREGKERKRNIVREKNKKRKKKISNSQWENFCLI